MILSNIEKNKAENTIGSEEGRPQPPWEGSIWTKSRRRGGDLMVALQVKEINLLFFYKDGKTFAFYLQMFFSPTNQEP